MHLLMKTSLSGPTYNFQRGATVPFDDAFPFSAGEVRRFIDPDGADFAEYVGETADLDAWLAQWVEPMRALFGSSILPAIVDIGGYKIQLGGIVFEAFTQFRGDLPKDTDAAAASEAWNDRPEAEREAYLAAVIEQLTSKPHAIDRVINETSILERPTPAAEEAKPAETVPPAADAATAPAAAAKPVDAPAPEKAAKPAAPKKTAARKG